METIRTHSVSIQRWISRSWQLFWQEPFIFVLAAFFYFFVVFGTSGFEDDKRLMSFGYILLNGPLVCGFYALYFHLMRGQSVTFSTFFEGFQVYLPAVLASFVLLVFLSIGYAFFILPGLIVEALFIFTYPLILDKRMGFWEAMMTSKRVVRDYLFEFSGYILLKWLLYLSGVFLLGIGILVMFPLFLGSVAVAYAEIFGLEDESTAR